MGERVEPREALFNAICYRVSFIDGGVSFMETSPIYGCASILTVERSCGCWYLSDYTQLPSLSTLSKMHDYLARHVANIGDPEDAPLMWREAPEPTP